MKAQWGQWMARFDALQPRERLMLVLGVLVLMWALFDNLLLTPMLNRQKLYRQEMSTDQNTAAQFQQQTQQLLQAAKIDPDEGSRQRLSQLQQQLAEKDAQLQSTQQQLIAPDRMPRVLESLLQRDKSIKLVSLTTMPVSGLMEGGVVADGKTKAHPADSGTGIYRHGFEIRLEGGYLDLLRYATTLENSAWHMLWGEMKLDATTYPRSTLILNVYTLSLDKAWLSL